MKVSIQYQGLPKKLIAMPKVKFGQKSTGFKEWLIN